MKRIKKRLFIYGIISLFVGSFLGFAFSSLTAHAQFPEGGLNLTATPQTPGPNEEVLLRVESFSINLNTSQIRWFVNGRTHDSGVGKKSITITTGERGETTTVRVSATTQNGVVLRDETSFTPADVFLVWEVETYTPPFYKGKALMTSDNAVTITAVPWFTTNGTSFLNPEGLIYTWSKNGRKLGNQSGFGKRTLTITGPSLFQEINISVDVVSQGGSLRAQDSIILSPQEPEVVLYEKHPLRGVLFNNTLEESFLFEGDEMTLYAEPYFFSKEDVFRNITFNWSLNNRRLGDATGREVVFGRPEESGVSRVGIEVLNDNVLLQTAKNTLDVVFGTPSRLGQ